MTKFTCLLSHYGLLVALPFCCLRTARRLRDKIQNAVVYVTVSWVRSSKTIWLLDKRFWRNICWIIYQFQVTIQGVNIRLPQNTHGDTSNGKLRCTASTPALNQVSWPSSSVEVRRERKKIKWKAETQVQITYALRYSPGGNILVVACLTAPQMLWAQQSKQTEWW